MKKLRQRCKAVATKRPLGGLCRAGRTRWSRARRVGREVVVMVACLHVERVCTVWLRNLVGKTRWDDSTLHSICRHSSYDVRTKRFLAQDPLKFTESLIILSN